MASLCSGKQGKQCPSQNRAKGDKVEENESAGPREHILEAYAEDDRDEQP